MAVHPHEGNGTSHIFNTDKGTGKSIPRSFMNSGMSQPVQFNAPSRFNGAVGETTNLGSVMGGGMGKANDDAGKAVGAMPPIPKGAILGA